jgi:sucrose-6-phosphate hydrolase SacC (GH32 family)
MPTLRKDDDQGIDSGSVYVFEKNSTGWYEQVSKLVASDGAAIDRFGRAVAATDGMMVVGAHADDDNGAINSGSVYVFDKNSTGQYQQVGKLVASDGAADDNFGWAVAATDGIVLEPILTMTKAVILAQCMCLRRTALGSMSKCASWWPVMVLWMITLAGLWQRLTA